MMVMMQGRRDTSWRHAEEMVITLLEDDVEFAIICHLTVTTLSILKMMTNG